MCPQNKRKCGRSLVFLLKKIFTPQNVSAIGPRRQQIFCIWHEKPLSQCYASVVNDENFREGITIDVFMALP